MTIPVRIFVHFSIFLWKTIFVYRNAHKNEQFPTIIRVNIECLGIGLFPTAPAKDVFAWHVGSSPKISIYAPVVDGRHLTLVLPDIRRLIFKVVAQLVSIQYELN